MSKLKKTNYHLEFTADNMNHPGLLAKLVDNYLNTSTPVSLDGVTAVDFTVNNDAGSSAPDRFKLVIYTAAPLPVTFMSIKAYQQNTNIVVEWKTDNETNISKYEVERSTDGTNFSKSATQVATGNNGGSVSYSWTDVNPAAGYNFYRVRSVGVGGDIKYSATVRVNMQKGAPGIVVYPNPVIDHRVTLQFNNMEKGEYSIRLINSMGQVVSTSKITHAGGNASLSILLDNTVSKGNYIMQVFKQGTEAVVTKLIVE